MLAKAPPTWAGELVIFGPWRRWRWSRQDEIDSQLVQDVSALVEKNRGLLEASVASCDRYCEVLRCVGRYIDARWEPWRGLVAAETRGLVAEVCDVFSVSEQVLALSLRFWRARHDAGRGRGHQRHRRLCS